MLCCLLLALLVSVSGCGRPRPAQEPRSAQGEPEPAPKLRLWAYEQGTKRFFEKAVGLWNDENPDARIGLEFQPARSYAEMLELAFQSGDVPDFFVFSGSPPLEWLVREKKIAALDDLASSRTAFREWVSRFSSGESLFHEWVNMFDGRVYTFPLRGYDAGFVTYYNREILARSGFSGPPADWESQREMAAKVSQGAGGKGKVYGVALGGMYPIAWEALSQLAVAAGWPARGWDWSTARFDYTKAVVTDWIAHLVNLKSDGSILPGETSYPPDTAMRAFAKGSAAFYFGSSWDARTVSAYNPDLALEVSLPAPQVKGRRLGYFPVDSFSATGLLVSSKAPREDAWRFIDFLTSARVQEIFVSEGSGISAVRAANTPENFPQKALAVQAELAENATTAPPRLTKDALRVWMLLWRAMEPVRPDFWDTVPGIYAGKADVSSLADVETRMNQAVDRALAAIENSGVPARRDWFRFPGWGPAMDRAE